MHEDELLENRQRQHAERVQSSSPVKSGFWLRAADTGGWESNAEEDPSSDDDVDKKPWDKGGFKLIEKATVDGDMKMALVHQEKFDKYYIICRGTDSDEIRNVIQAVEEAPTYQEALEMSQKWQESHTIEAIGAHS